MPDVSRLDPATLDIARNIGVYLHPFFRHPDTLNGVRPAKRVMTLPALAISAGRTSALLLPILYRHPSSRTAGWWVQCAGNHESSMHPFNDDLRTQSINCCGNHPAMGTPPFFLARLDSKALAKFKCIRIARASCDAAALSSPAEKDRDICTNLPPQF